MSSILWFVAPDRVAAVEIGTRFGHARSGGESLPPRIYHPAPFVSGDFRDDRFAAPPPAAIAFGTYVASVPFLPPTCCGALIVCSRRPASTPRQAVQPSAYSPPESRVTTAFASLHGCLSTPPDIRMLPAPGCARLPGAFAVPLSMTTPYSWKRRDLPTRPMRFPPAPRRSCGDGNRVVLYLSNFTFLYAAPVDAMAGKIEIGYIASRFVFGDSGAAVMGIVLALLLVSTVSAMTLAGPRVLQVVGQDFTVFRLLARTNAHGVPTVAVLFQSTLALVFVVTAPLSPYWCSRDSPWA